MRDIIILGGGPAGLCAGVYAQRAGLNSVLVEKLPLGAGQITESECVDNYLGLPQENGFMLANKFRNHAKDIGVEFINNTAMKIYSNNELLHSYTVELANGKQLKTKCIIYALGTVRKKLNVKGECQFTGKGVSYCAVCDGAFYKDKTAVVVGGGNTAVSDAILLSKFAKKVYLIHRRATLRAYRSLQQQLDNLSNLQLVLNSNVIEIIGDNKVAAVKIKKENTCTTIKTDGVFIAVGTVPESSLLKGIAQLDKNGYVIADETGATSAKGIFAAGDVRTKQLKQIITAASDGANCVHSAEIYLAH